MNDLVYFHKSKLDTLADKINEKIGGVEPLSLDEMVGKIDKIDDNKALREVLENKTSLLYFYYNYKGEGIIPFKKTYKVTNLNNFCGGCTNLKSWENIYDTNIVIDFTSMFSDCSSITNIEGLTTENGERCSNLFKECIKLGKILTPLNFKKMKNVNDCFYNCESLQYIRFVSESIILSLSFAQSPLLSAESVQSIIDGLAPVTTAQTITFHKNIALTDEQKQTINEKGWTLVQA